jgi:hypothetical protein
MRITTTITYADSTTETFTIDDFTKLPAASQLSITSYGFGRKINDTGNGAAKAAKDAGGTIADQTTAKRDAANKIFVAIKDGTLGAPGTRAPKVNPWDAEALDLITATYPKVAAALKGQKGPALAAIKAKALAKYRDSVAEQVDAIMAARAVPVVVVDEEFDF